MVIVAFYIKFRDTVREVFRLLGERVTALVEWRPQPRLRLAGHKNHDYDDYKSDSDSDTAARTLSMSRTDSDAVATRMRSLSQIGSEGVYDWLLQFPSGVRSRRRQVSDCER